MFWRGFCLGLQYETDEDVCQKFWIKPLKVNNLATVLAFCDPKKKPKILKNLLVFSNSFMNKIFNVLFRNSQIKARPNIEKIQWASCLFHMSVPQKVFVILFKNLSAQLLNCFASLFSVSKWVLNCKPLASRWLLICFLPLSVSSWTSTNPHS